MLHYKIIQKANPRKPEEPNKYYAAAVNSGNADFRDFINDIARLSTVNTPDIVAVLESLFQLVPNYLKEGKIVKFGDLGSFTVLLDSAGQEKPEDVSIRDIKQAKIRFIPSKRLKEELNKIDYKKESRKSKN
jgi:predicted histone-like DNA-binding protein